MPRHKRLPGDAFAKFGRRVEACYADTCALLESWAEKSIAFTEETLP
jgi:hypothetical protein